VQILFGLRAAFAFGLGVFITFSQAHTFAVGTAVVAGFGLAVGLSSLAYILFTKNHKQLAPLMLIATLIGLLSAGTFLYSEIQPLVFLPLVGLFGLSFAAFEGYLAKREGFRVGIGRDFAISAGFSLVLGLLFLVAPLDEVSAVGFLGAYLAISGVFWGIAAATPQPK
jgi:ABC-type multidrug transport system permease subunit